MDDITKATEELKEEEEAEKSENDSVLEDAMGW